MEKMRHILLLKGILYISTYPYNFVKQYKKMDVIIYKDSDGKLHIMHKGKKLYGKFSWTEKQFSEYYRALQMEQDLHSPHCYTGSGGKYLEERIPGNDDILADIGAAEGIFALDYVDKVKKIYLFECDREWIEPLRKTFQQWEKKVEIVEKYVGKEMNDRSIALDTFFQDTDVTYVKADIEGAEVDMLAGGEKTFKNKIKKTLLCAYHNNEDENKIIDYCSKYGFEMQINEGYMILTFDKNFKRPFFRRGIIFGKKDNIEN